MEMDEATSLRLFLEGATFVFLNIPIGTSVGIDMHVWKTGEKFKGIKMIPPGLHFIHFSAVDKHGQEAPRTGFFHFFKKAELLVKTYDQKAEDFGPDLDEGAKMTMKDQIMDMDKNLGAYPYDTWRTWVSLTNHITLELLERLKPLNGRVTSVPEMTLDKDQTPSEPSTSRRRKLTKLEEAEAQLPKMTENPESKIRFTPLPTQEYPQDSAPHEITKHLLDKSFKFETMLGNFQSPVDYLGEIQFSFVSFLVGQSYDSFEHWKSLVELITFSDASILNHQELYSQLLSDLYFQANQVPPDTFQDIVTNNNFIFSSFQRLFQNMKGQRTIESKLRLKAERFEKFLAEKFSWDFDGEDEEDEPVLVEINE